MQTNWEEIMQRVTDFMESEARTETVIGKSFQVGEFECVPVIRIGMGFGSASGEGDAPKQGHGEGGATGAGLGIEPIGFLAVRNDQISFINTRSNKGLNAMFEKAPDLIEKFLENQREQKEEVVN